MKFRVLVEQDEDGFFVAECPNLPGVVSQGKTREEVIINIKDAIKGYLESLKKANEPIPRPITEEVVDIYGSVANNVWSRFNKTTFNIRLSSSSLNRNSYNFKAK